MFRNETKDHINYTKKNNRQNKRNIKFNFWCKLKSVLKFSNAKHEVEYKSEFYESDKTSKSQINFKICFLYLAVSNNFRLLGCRFI